MKAKLAITLERDLLKHLDRLVAAGDFPNRSQAIESAVRERLDRLTRRRLAAECAKLDPEEERDFAERGLDADAASWPTY